MPVKTVDQTSEQVEKGMTYGLLAILLTVLDKEIHFASYFDAARTEDDQYIESIRKIAKLHTSMLDSEQIKLVIQQNPHLKYVLHTKDLIMDILEAEGHKKVV